MILALAIIAVFLGTTLIVVECFLPGIGVAGFSGGILSALGIIGLIPYIGWYVVFVILAIIIIAVICVMMFARSAEKGKNPLVLSQKTDKESGFSANDDNSALINKEGVAVTQLRPAGIATIDNKRVDVVTNGEFLETGTPVRVTDIQGRRIIVEQIKGGN